jgi:hypothetical protein
MKTLIIGLIVAIGSLVPFSCAKTPPAQVPTPVPPPEITIPPPVGTPTPAPTPVTIPTPTPAALSTPAPPRPPWPNVDIYTDMEKTITTSVNQEFAIALYSNPRLGTNWYETHDGNMLALMGRTFNPDNA